MCYVLFQYGQSAKNAENAVLNCIPPGNERVFVPQLFKQIEGGCEAVPISRGMVDSKVIQL